MNKELLEPIMRAHGDKNKDLAAAIGMSVPNFSTIWNGRGEFALKYIRLIARRYSLTPEQSMHFSLGFLEGDLCLQFLFPQFGFLFGLAFSVCLV